MYVDTLLIIELERMLRDTSQFRKKFCPATNALVNCKCYYCKMEVSHGWSGVNMPPLDSVFSGVINHTSLSGSLMDESGLDERQEKAQCQQ